MPPFEGPRATLWVTRQPVKTSHRAVVHRGRDRHLDRLLALAEDADEVVVDLEGVGDVPELLLRDPERVLGRVSPCSATVCLRFLRCAYCIRKAILRPARLPRERRPGDEPDLVAAGGEHRAVRPAAGDPEAVGAGQQVAEVERARRGRRRSSCRAARRGARPARSRRRRRRRPGPRRPGARPGPGRTARRPAGRCSRRRAAIPTAGGRRSPTGSAAARPREARP